MTLVIVVCAAGALAANALSFGRDWRLVLLSNFRAHIAAALVVLALAVALTDLGPAARLALAAALLLSAVIGCWSILSAIRRSQESVEGRTLRLAFSNLLEFNRQHPKLLDWVGQAAPDIVVVAEALLHWRQALVELERNYPYWAGSRQGDVRIYSRLPFESEPVDLFAEVGHAVVVQVAGLTLAGVHTASPEGAIRSRSLDDLLAQLSAWVRRIDGPVVVVGDFNAAPWTRPVRRLVDDASLAYGPGALTGTFPIGIGPLRFPRWFCIPIDIVVAGKGARVVSRRHGPDIGSDHWPILADIVLAKMPEKPASGAA